jgi:voltage-gated potassium channel Kch
MKIFLPIIVGGLTSVGSIIVHACALRMVIYVVQHERLRGRAGVHFWLDVAIVAAATLIALVAHLAEIALWALVFVGCGEFSDLAAALYHSAENYTTLGYGDVVMSAAWRLLGPLEAADGMLMFGVSTALIFTVINRLVSARLHLSSS